MNKPQPPKLSKDKLVHPKAEKKSKFNGDTIKPPEDQGFAASRAAKGLTVVEGKRKPSGLRFPVDAPPRPLGRPMESPPAIAPPLTPRQQKMMRGGNGRKR